MKIAVCGLWHLGTVTAACLAQAGYEILGYDPEPNTIQQLKKNHAPVFEPGLNELIAEANANGKLSYTTTAKDLAEAEILWITFDTPVDENDQADTHYVINEINKIIPHLQPQALLIISSQLPVGTTRQLQQYHATHYPEKKLRFAYSPENLRLGKAIAIFTHPDRIVVGIESEQDKKQIQHLLQPFSHNIIWMSVASAEMTKHALNAFLATSVVFINELATLCERVGANAKEVELGLKSEERIGTKAYLKPGNAIAGGTLARDVNYLIQIGQKQQLATPFFSALLTSNHHHKQWSCRKISEVFNDLNHKTITTLGLTYKPGTDTLRRSAAIETCQWLSLQGARVLAYDPAIRHLPEEFIAFIELKASLTEALKDTDAVIIATECPEFNTLSVATLLENSRQPYIFDANGFLANIFAHDPRLHYFSVGRQS